MVGEKMLDIFSGINNLEIEDKTCMYLNKNKLYCGLGMIHLSYNLICRERTCSFPAFNRDD